MTTFFAEDVRVARLFDAVKAAFLDDGSATPNEFGWRAPSYQTREIDSRVCWVPGDATNGDAGELAPAYKPGRAPERPLASFLELFTVFCYATAQGEDLTNEIAQYIAARNLFRYFYRRLHNAAYEIGLNRRFAVKKAGWVNDKKERPHGATLRVLFQLQDDLPDDDFVFAPPPVTGRFETGIATPTNDAEGNPIKPDPITTSDGTLAVEPEE